LKRSGFETIIKAKVICGGEQALAGIDWDKLSYDAKNQQLFLQQKRTLELFLERGAISQEQFNKSLRDLTAKMKAKGLLESGRTGSLE
jgi:hypothetical protein